MEQETYQIQSQRPYVYSDTMLPNKQTPRSQISNNGITTSPISQSSRCMPLSPSSHSKMNVNQQDNILVENLFLKQITYSDTEPSNFNHSPSQFFGQGQPEFMSVKRLFNDDSSFRHNSSLRDPQQLQFKSDIDVFTRSEDEGVSTTLSQNVQQPMQLQFIQANRIAGLKILNFLKLARNIQQVYKKKLNEFVVKSIIQIQRIFKLFIIKRRRKQGFIYAELFLDISQAKKVEIFGDFTKQAWIMKNNCQQVSQTLWKVSVFIKMGNSFKFCIDDGQHYKTSLSYQLCSDGQGGHNNKFIFHSRTPFQNKEVIRQYKIIKIPHLQIQLSECAQLFQNYLREQNDDLKFVNDYKPSILFEEKEQNFLDFLSFENILEHKIVAFDELFESMKKLDTDKIQVRRSLTLQQDKNEKLLISPDFPKIQSFVSNVPSFLETSNGIVSQTDNILIETKKEVKDLCMKSAGYSISKSDNNEDAYFISERGFGVADGVSGWNDYGFSSSAFSNQLMEYCKSELQIAEQEEDIKAESKQKLKKMRKSFVNLEDLDDCETHADDDEQYSFQGLKTKRDIYSVYILDKAFMQVTEIGSSTAMIGIQNGKRLSICNLGDSGFQLYRQAQNQTYLASRSKEQIHSFNIPFQLCRIPSDDDCEQLRLKGKCEEAMKLQIVLRKTREIALAQDQPEDADEYTIDIQEGDIIISATDGLFDNLFNHEILSVLQTTKEMTPADIAKAIVTAAHAKVTATQRVTTPYQRKYKKTYNATLEGGKNDDITCVVTKILPL